MIFIISFLQTIFISAIDALIKGNIVAHYDTWQQVPWYWKDANFIYPWSIMLIFGLGIGILIMRKSKWGWTYLLMLGIWIGSGLESLAYWLSIVVFKINQTMWWLPDDSFFWWYPREAPWMNTLFYLRWISKKSDVTREAVLWGVAIAFCINLGIYVYKKSREASDMLN